MPNSSYQEILSRVDLLLGEPHPASPSLPLRWEVLRNCVHHLFNLTVNTPVPWVTGSVLLTVNNSTDTFLVAANDFGKDILVETYDASDPYHIPRPVSRVSLQSQPYSFMPQSGDEITVDGAVHSARTMAFFRQSSAVYVRVSPKPTQTATYKIWYELASPNTDALSNGLTVPGGDSYLTTLCAVQLLPYCHWSGNTKDEDTRQRRELMDVLAPSAAVQEKQWRILLATDRQAGKVHMNGFLDEEFEFDYPY